MLRGAGRPRRAFGGAPTRSPVGIIGLPLPWITSDDADGGRGGRRGTMATMSTDTTGTAARDEGPRPGDPADSPFVRACRREPGPHTPVWFMRQAGRSLPEYRKIRSEVAMLESCRRPDLITEITLQPVRRHKVDAAILFSDIVVPVAAAGVALDIVPGTGPVVTDPVTTRADVERIRLIDRDDVHYVDEAVRMLVDELGGTPLIGFAGAPFTLASYLVEGGPSRTHVRTKALMYGDPDLWHALAGRLAEMTLAFLKVQIDAGVSAVQLFDSWAGALSEADYRRYVLPHSRAVLAGLADAGVPRIHFGVGTGEHRPRWARRAPTWWASTGVRRWTSPLAGSVPSGPCRATSTRACCSPRGRSSRPRYGGCWPRGVPPPGTSSISATECCRRPTPRC